LFIIQLYREQNCIVQLLLEALQATHDHTIIILLCHISLKSKLEYLTPLIFHQYINEHEQIFSSSTTTTTTTKGSINPDKIYIKYIAGLYTPSSLSLDHITMNNEGISNNNQVTGCQVAASIQYYTGLFSPPPQLVETKTSTSSAALPLTNTIIPKRIWIGYVGIDLPYISSDIVNSTFNLSYFQRYLSLLSYIPNSWNESLVSTIAIGFIYMNNQSNTTPNNKEHTSISVSIPSSSSLSNQSWSSLYQLLSRYYK